MFYIIAILTYIIALAAYYIIWGTLSKMDYVLALVAPLVYIVLVEVVYGL